MSASRRLLRASVANSGASRPWWIERTAQIVSCVRGAITTAPTRASGPATAATAAGSLEETPGLGQEGRTAQQVDVRVEHGREDRDRPERRADGVAAGGQCPKGEQREHVARHGQGQDEGPLDPRATGEVAERDEHR